MRFVPSIDPVNEWYSITDDSDNIISQSYDISLVLQNSGEQIYANSTWPETWDNFNLTVDQLEGEINVPYQFQNDKITTVRKIVVPNSILGGFAQFRINYTYIQYPEATSFNPETLEAYENQGTVVVGSVNTPRILVPKIIYDDEVEDIPSGFTFDINQIKESFADKIYDKFVENIDNIGDIKSLQTTVRDGFITSSREEGDKLVFFKKDRNTPEIIKDFDEGNLSLIINDISSSLSVDAVVGPQDISSFLDTQIDVVHTTPTEVYALSEEDRQSYNERFTEPVWIYMNGQQVMEEVLSQIDAQIFYKNIKYDLIYAGQTGNITVPFAEYRILYLDEQGTAEFSDLKIWTNILNLSQLTAPI